MEAKKNHPRSPRGSGAESADRGGTIRMRYGYFDEKAREYVITNPDKPSALNDYVKEADNLMYQIKQAVHARDGMPRR